MNGSMEDIEIGRTEAGQPYVVNRHAIKAVMRILREGYYCTVVGPRYCQKTQLLFDLQSEIRNKGTSQCILIDFRKGTWRYHDWPNHFIDLLSERIKTTDGLIVERPIGVVGPDLVLQRFVESCLQRCSADLYLLLNGLERLPFPILKQLLVVLRALHAEVSGQHRFCVVAVASTRLYGIALGPTSPFNIAQNVIIKDLSEGETLRLIREWAKQKSIAIEDLALKRLWAATRGDRILIDDLMTELLQRHAGSEISCNHVEQVLFRPLKRICNSHIALESTAQILESDPTLLLNAMKILHRGMVSPNELRRSLEDTDVDSLELSGGFRRHTDEVGDLYTVRNEVYEQFLHQKFTDGHVAQLLKFAGKWKEAFEYLGSSAQADPADALKDLLIDWIHNAQGESEAFEGLALGIRYVMACKGVSVYRMSTGTSLPVLASTSADESVEAAAGFIHERMGPLIEILNGPTDMIEYGDGNNKGIIFRLESPDAAIPCFGAVMLEGIGLVGSSYDSQTIHEFLTKIGQAIGHVRKRDMRMAAAYARYQSAKSVPETRDIDRICDGYAELAVQAVPKAGKGILFLWNDDENHLKVHGHYGFVGDGVHEIRLPKKRGYVGWSFSNQKPVLVPEAEKDHRTVFFDGLPGVGKERSGICVPLEAWGRSLGVLCLLTYGAALFDEGDLSVLATLAPYMAMGIQNALISLHLYDCGIAIHQSHRSEKEIFRLMVNSLKKICNLTGANLLLLDETLFWDQNLAAQPRLSLSDGLGEDYDAQIRPRENGLTYMAIQDGRAHWVSDPKISPGLHPMAAERGVQASICFPLILRESVRGVLFIHYDQPHEFSNSEVGALGLFANQAALAIENALQRKDLALANSVAWMGFTYSDLVHEMGLPIATLENTIFLARSLLAKKTEDFQKLESQLLRADGCVAEMKWVLNQALKPLKPQPETINVTQALKEIVPRWCKSDPNIQIVYDFEKHDALAVIDRTRMEWLIKILISNAVRAMRESSQKQITLQVRSSAAKIWVRISDTGKGIPIPIMMKLFKEPIARTEGALGTGVGLLIAKGIIKLSDGDIVVENTQHGATFRFDLPRAASMKNA